MEETKVKIILTYTVSGFYDILTKRKLTQGKSTLFKGLGTGKTESKK